MPNFSFPPMSKLCALSALIIILVLFVAANPTLNWVLVVVALTAIAVLIS